jgi:hypothetical protein
VWTGSRLLVNVACNRVVRLDRKLKIDMVDRSYLLDNRNRLSDYQIGTVNLSNPRAIFAGSPPRFTKSRVTYEAYVVSRTSTRPQVDSAGGGDGDNELVVGAAGGFEQSP